MSNPPPSEGSRWLLLVASLPTEDPAARMRGLRTLEALGAAVLREGVYLLPETTTTRQGLEFLSDYISKGAGNAQVLAVMPVTEAQQLAFRSMFDRSARYDELLKVVDSLKVGYGIADPSAVLRVLHKKRHDFEAINALDFFPGELQERVRTSLAEAEAAVHKLMFPAQAQASGAPDQPMRRRVWATRKPAWADRLACAWLIRRFADPEGTVVWLDKSQEVHPDSVGFAFTGARFGNSETQVTFEVMLQHFGLATNAALVKIGAIVHFLEAHDTPVAEAAGVQTLLQGAARRSNSDDELLAEAEKTFDLLYEAYFEAPTA
jgi:hypothetical protein